MKILSIETSCDETALSIIDAGGELDAPTFSILSNQIASQIEIHKEYGGVFPALAKREHSKNILPLLEKTLNDAHVINSGSTTVNEDAQKKAHSILEREDMLSTQLLEYVSSHEIPDIDLIAVTYGPGLEPALWVGLNFAKALSVLWNKTLIPVNHMEGHLVSSLLSIDNDPTGIQKINKVEFPAISLLISGGHTELVLVKNWMDYTILGETVDDAVGEAFDKVARMLELPYPGGPEISKLAEKSSTSDLEITLPRPMINSKDYNFSFSGLKTAVLYKLKEFPEITDDIKITIAKEFQNAATDVLIKKTMRAADEYGAKTILVGGGVAANTHIRETLENESENRDLMLRIPRKDIATDNSIMIGMAGYFRYLGSKNGTIDLPDPHPLRACGNLGL
ncbi:tRNA (adenosine(37)-N6)-threonylcarbamoyltransferase complex transferase subunit TsaD [Candidatus Wolfebacteria bacterium]|nr:MAG: tRNA (adenosine(37)-N6)-threonylcarbamoyltransferase complex transferase subunit TsaD [Candidatus Wolfebacteria bacterium]